MLLLVPPYTYMIKAAPAAGTYWDKWTAIGTLILAVVTFLTLLYTISATSRDRKQAKKDREDAETRLTEEREAGDRRVKAEREHAAEVRRRDRQIAYVAVLVRRVAEIQASLAAVPAWVRRTETGVRLRSDEMSAADQRVFEAMTSLRHGAWTETAMLGTGKAAEQAAYRYRMLLILVDDAASEDNFPDLDKESLRNYARWVLISLRMLAEDETVPQISKGHPENPGSPGQDNWVWNPEPLPPGWWNMELADSPGR